MDESSQISLLIISGTAGMLILVAALILFVVFYQKKMLKSRLDIQMLENEHQKNLLKASFESQENERMRIARDLHDEVGAMLSAINLNISSVMRNKQISEDIANSLDNTKSMVNQSIETVRSISRNLLPHMLEDFGLSKAIEHLTQRIQNTDSFHIEFTEEGQNKELESNAELSLYRSIQEIINNAIKHSKGDTIKVQFLWHPKQLVVSISDNGVGFDVTNNEFKKGLGLKNIESRLNLINAGFDYESDNTGTRIRILLNI